MTTPTIEQLAAWGMFKPRATTSGVREAFDAGYVAARADLEAENAELKKQVEFWQTDRKELQEKDDAVITQQAEAIERLTELVLRNEHGWFGLTSYWVINNPEKADAQFLKNAQENQAKRLAIQPNPDILRERDARLVERIAEIEHVFITPIVLRKIADQIRKGEWK